MKLGHVLLALTIRNWSARIGKSPLEVIWIILEPCMHLIFYLVVIGLVPRRPPVGESFALFFASGILLYFLYQRVFFRISITMNFQPLQVLQRITFVHILCSCLIIEVILWICNLAVLAIVVELVGQSLGIANPLTVGYALGLALLLATAWGAFSGFMLAFLPFWSKVTNFLNRCIYFSCGIFFLPDHTVPFIRDVIYWNPLLHIIELARTGIYFGYTSTTIDLWVPYTYALVLATAAAVIQHAATERFRLQ
jgi:capsular polysaccharide transport system permease protein